MVLEKDKKVPWKIICWIIYCGIILSASVYSLKKPAYNWDMLPYMGVILSYDNMDAKTIHNQVYTVAKEKIPAAFYNQLTATSSQYRTQVAQDFQAFRMQMPFYVVKPLYTGIGYLFFKAGASLPMATVWPTVISYFLMGLLFFYWLQKYWPVLFAFAGSLLIMLSGPMMSLAKLSTPDALSALLLFAAVFLITEKRSLTWPFIFLLLAVFARLDNIIAAIFLLTTISFSNKWAGKIAIGKFVLLLSAIILSYFIISFNTQSFGWSLFYYPSFIKQLNTSYTINSGFIFKDYVGLVKSQFMTGLYFSILSLFFFLVLFLVWENPVSSFNRLSLEQTLAIVFVLIIISRFVLQPLITDRLYIPYYLSVVVFLTKKYSFSTTTIQSYRR